LSGSARYSLTKRTGTFFDIGVLRKPLTARSPFEFNYCLHTMPTYVYRRQDGTTFEIQQRITEDPLKTCPETNQPVTRVISANTGLIFKGSGFYLTDYARNGGAKSDQPGDSSSASAESQTSDSSASKQESTSSTKEAA
jgi:putative FmdB family regulatory protein